MSTAEKQQELNFETGEVATEETPTTTMTPGEIIKAMDEVRDERRKISARDKQLVELWRGLEAQMLHYADEQGVKQVATDVGTATVTFETLPNVADWDALYAYILENQALHMLQRRVSSASFRELQDAGEDVPGIEPYIQRKVSLRKAK